MNKLGNKEVILILLVINFMLYYLMVMIGVTPLKNSIKSNNAAIETLQAEYDEKKAIVDKEDDYKADIVRLTDEKAVLFQTGFPNTEAESLHAFINKEATNSSISINNISISQSARMANGEDGQQETGIMDNKITVDCIGSYANVISLLETIEKMQRTSILTSLDLGGEAANMSITMQYSFLSADKTDIDDTVFDHTFGQSAGNTTLFK